MATATLNQKFDLNAIVKGNPFVEYNPKRFPGLVFRIKRPKSAILMFSTGKMVCTGATKEEDVYIAVDKLHKNLKEKELIYYE